MLADGGTVVFLSPHVKYTGGVVSDVQGENGLSVWLYLHPLALEETVLRRGGDTWLTEALVEEVTLLSAWIAVSSFTCEGC